MLTHQTPLRTHYIYALVDPRTDLTRYIGRTCAPGRRLSRHMDAAADVSDTSPRAGWIREMRVAGLRPRLVILETVPFARVRMTTLAHSIPGTEHETSLERAFDIDVSAAEYRWLDHARAHGWPVLNRGD